MEAGAVLILESGLTHAGVEAGLSTGTSRRVSDAPSVMSDVLGEPVLYRIIESLRRSGIGEIFVLADRVLVNHPHIRSLRRSCVQVIPVPEGGFGVAVRTAFRICRDRGLRSTAVMRTPIYIEFDAAAVAEFHRSTGEEMTLLCRGTESLGVAVVDCDHVDEAVNFVSQNPPAKASTYNSIFYVNELQSPQDLRRLAQDALLGLCKIQPNGVQLRPGVWVGVNARIHSQARVVAPAYIGPGTRIHAGVQVSCNSVIERDCELDCGCAVEDASVLSGTYLGVGLKISRAVVDPHRLVSLDSNVNVEMLDPALFRSTSLSPKEASNGSQPSNKRSFLSSRPFLDRLRDFWPGRPAPAKSISRVAPEPWPMLEEVTTQANTGSI